MIYYVNMYNDEHGRHEVHTKDCSFLPKEENRIYLGNFNNCQEAINEAKRKWPDPQYKFDGCYYCSINCHKG